jgi:hypothetical protein
VAADEDEGAGGDVHYVAVEQDLDQSPEGPKARFANEGKPRFIINPWFMKLCNYPCYSMCIYVQELNETLVAWSLGAYVLLLVDRSLVAML